MPRKLKTFVTNLGFFELAVAAPSMKAALEAWGMSHNAFQHGFAKQTQDPDIIAATEAEPGVVLRRPVGSDGAFTQDAQLPKSLPALKPPRVEAAKKAKKKETARPAKPAGKQTRASIISFEKARAAREKRRAREAAQQEKERAQRARKTEKTQAAFEKAGERHETALAKIAGERDRLDRREQQENERWEAERRRLKAELDRAEL